MTIEHSILFRMKFLDQVDIGESLVDLASMALAQSGEDDALVSHSASLFPSQQFAIRIRRMADDFRRQRLINIEKQGAHARDIVNGLQAFFYDDMEYSIPTFGRSALRTGERVDHPGVWERPSFAYMHSVLIHKTGIPAMLAIILGSLVQELIKGGDMKTSHGESFFAKVVCGSMEERPSIEIIDGFDPVTIDSNGNRRPLNPCSFDAMRETQLYLKRAFWPFPWESQGSATTSAATGGFEAAARAFLEGSADTAESEAISRAALHRLQRGIWTSPGAGDIRRSKAAAERAVVLLGDGVDPWVESMERRDLGVLYCHCGEYEYAHAEFRRCMELLPKMNETMIPGGHTSLLQQLLVATAQALPSSTAPPGTCLDAQVNRYRCQKQRDAPPQVLPLTW